MRDCRIPMGALPRHFAELADRPMITVAGETLTARQLDERANRRARVLQRMGVQVDDFVMVMLPNGIEFFETSFAVWKLGATVNVVSPRLPDVELRSIIDLVKPRLIVGLDQSRAAGTTSLPAGYTPPPEASSSPVPAQVATYWRASTSGGSTGRPKVIVEHQSSTWDPGVRPLLQRECETVLIAGPLYQTAPFTLSHTTLFGGGQVVLMPKFDPEEALRLIDRHKVTWTHFVPTMMSRIWHLPEAVKARYDVSSLRIMLHMAAPCPAWLKEKWIEWLGPERIWEAYSGSERQGRTLISGTEWLRKRGSVGQVQPGSRLAVLSDLGEPCPAGTIGEVCFLPDGGKSSTYHYIGAEAHSHGEWESLGDLGYLDEDGYLFLADRRSDLILSGGSNIYPAEIEAALEASTLVDSSAVVGLPDDDMGQRVHAIVHLRNEVGLELAEAELRAFLPTQLQKYKLPRTYEFVDAPLRDEQGKVRRSALKEARIQEAGMRSGANESRRDRR